MPVAPFGWGRNLEIISKDIWRSNFIALCPDSYLKTTSWVFGELFHRIGLGASDYYVISQFVSFLK